MRGPAVHLNRYAPGARHAPHAHDYTNISLVLSGALIERVGRVEEYAGPLSMVVKPADTEHADQFGPAGARLLQLHVPDDWTGCLSEGWRWVRSLAAARWLLRFAADDPPDADDALAECLGALDGAAPHERRAPPAWLTRVRERLADECARRPRVTDLARDAGVHPVHLTREFRRAYGTSVMGCLQEERVRRAADALAGGQAPISHVALAAGFVDQPYLTRIFKRACGVTPAEFRRTGGA